MTNHTNVGGILIWWGVVLVIVAAANYAHCQACYPLDKDSACCTNAYLAKLLTDVKSCGPRCQIQLRQQREICEVKVMFERAKGKLHLEAQSRKHKLQLDAIKRQAKADRLRWLGIGIGIGVAVGVLVTGAVVLAVKFR